MTKTGCFILSALWTKLGLLQRLYKWSADFIARSLGRPPRTRDRLPASPAAVACRARSRHEETDAFSAKLKTPNDIQLNRARSRHAH